MSLKDSFKRNIEIGRLRGELRQMQALGQKCLKRSEQMHAELAHVNAQAEQNRVFDLGAVERLTTEAEQLNQTYGNAITRVQEICAKLTELTGIPHRFEVHDHG